jgi:hypothetical protein
MKKRILPIADINLVRRRLKEIPAFDHSFDVEICAGDLWEGTAREGRSSVVALARGRPPIIVPGNHDLYTDGPETAAPFPNLIRLHRNEAGVRNACAHSDIVIRALSAQTIRVRELEQVRFIGLTLWTDWAQANRWLPNPDAHKGHGPLICVAEARVAAEHSRGGTREYQAIRTERGPWTPYDAFAEHARERARLIDELTNSHHGPTVVITHHPPLANCADVYRDRGLPWWAPALAVQTPPAIPEEIRPDLDIWSRACAFDIQCGRTCAIANPVEGGQFNPRLVVEVWNRSQTLSSIEQPEHLAPVRSLL